MNDEHKTINISTITILKIVSIGLLLWFLWVIKDILLILLIAIIISSAIDPVADFLYKRRIPRVLPLLIVRPSSCRPSLAHPFESALWFARFRLGLGWLFTGMDASLVAPVPCHEFRLSRFVT